MHFYSTFGGSVLMWLNVEIHGILRMQCLKIKIHSTYELS